MSAVAALLSTKDATFTPGVAVKRGPIAADMPHDGGSDVQADMQVFP